MAHEDGGILKIWDDCGRPDLFQLSAPTPLRDTNERVTQTQATRYLNELVEGGILEKQRVGRYNYYINVPLFEILTEGG